jgi:hypothetical protein
MLRCFLRSSGRLGSTPRRSISSLLTKTQQSIPRINRNPISLTLSTNLSTTSTTTLTDVSAIVLGSAIEATEETAETVISKMRNTTIFVDFYADWYDTFLTVYN